MNPEQQRRDAELRQAVEGHEFAFDPTAWSEMEQLLDGTGASGGNTSGKKWWKGGAWWLGGLILIGIGALLAWWSIASNSKKEEPLSNFPIYEVQEEADVRPRKVELIAPLPSRLIPLEEQPIELSRAIQPFDIQPRREPVQLIIPLETNRPEVVPQKANTETLRGEIPRLKRKRNRRTLFPDVIERY
jgi:hypothetical protein